MVFYQVLLGGEYLMAVSADLRDAAHAARAVVMLRPGSTMIVRMCDHPEVTNLKGAIEESLMEYPRALAPGDGPVGISRIMPLPEGEA